MIIKRKKLIVLAYDFHLIYDNILFSCGDFRFQFFYALREKFSRLKWKVSSKI